MRDSGAPRVEQVLPLHVQLEFPSFVPLDVLTDIITAREPGFPSV